MNFWYYYTTISPCVSVAFFVGDKDDEEGNKLVYRVSLKAFEVFFIAKK